MSRANLAIGAAICTLLLLAGCQGATPPQPTPQGPGLRVTIAILPSPTPTPRSLVVAPGQGNVPSTSDEVPRITAQDVTSLLNAGRDVVIVDVRDPEFYESKHILGAISLPYSSVEQRYAELPRGKTIVLYCT